jgi:hypothetical protein
MIHFLLWPLPWFVMAQYKQNRALGQVKTATRIKPLKKARCCVKKRKNDKGETAHDESGTDV